MKSISRKHLSVVAQNDIPRVQFKVVSAMMLLPVWPFAVPVYYFEGAKRPFLAVVPNTQALQVKKL